MAHEAEELKTANGAALGKALQQKPEGAVAVAAYPMNSQEAAHAQFCNAACSCFPLAGCWSPGMLGAGVPLCGAWQDRLPAMSLAKAALSALLGPPASPGIGVFVPGDTQKTHPVRVGGQLLCRVMDSPTGKAALLLDRHR